MTLDRTTPITAYGIVEVSRPMAAKLLGFSIKALNRRVREGQITASGRVKLTVRVDEIEAITSRRVTAHEYLTKLGEMADKPLRMAPLEGAGHGH